MQNLDSSYWEMASIRACHQSLSSVNMAVQILLSDIRDGAIDDDWSFKKFLALLGVEFCYLLNIPLGLLEIAVRILLLICLFPIRPLLSDENKTMVDNITCAGAIVSSAYLVNNLIGFIRSLHWGQKVEINAQMRVYTPCLSRLVIWAISTPSEYVSDPRR